MMRNNRIAKEAAAEVGSIDLWNGPYALGVRFDEVDSQAIFSRTSDLPGLTLQCLSLKGTLSDHRATDCLLPVYARTFNIVLAPDHRIFKLRSGEEKYKREVLVATIFYNLNRGALRVSFEAINPNGNQGAQKEFQRSYTAWVSKKLFGLEESGLSRDEGGPLQDYLFLVGSDPDRFSRSIRGALRAVSNQHQAQESSLASLYSSYLSENHRL